MLFHHGLVESSPAGWTDWTIFRWACLTWSEPNWSLHNHYRNWNKACNWTCIGLLRLVRVSWLVGLSHQSWLTKMDSGKKSTLAGDRPNMNHCPCGVMFASSTLHSLAPSKERRMCRTTIKLHIHRGPKPNGRVGHRSAKTTRPTWWNMRWSACAQPRSPRWWAEAMMAKVIWKAAKQNTVQS